MIDWEYDREADVLYLSLGEPTPAVGVDIGEGVILRYDEECQEVVGLTLIGLRTRLQASLKDPPKRNTRRPSVGQAARST